MGLFLRKNKEKSLIFVFLSKLKRHLKKRETDTR